MKYYTTQISTFFETHCRDFKMSNSQLFCLLRKNQQILARLFSVKFFLLQTIHRLLFWIPDLCNNAYIKLRILENLL